MDKKEILEFIGNMLGNVVKERIQDFLEAYRLKIDEETNHFMDEIKIHSKNTMERFDKLVVNLEPLPKIVEELEKRVLKLEKK